MLGAVPLAEIVGGGVGSWIKVGAADVGGVGGVAAYDVVGGAGGLLSHLRR